MWEHGRPAPLSITGGGGIAKTQASYESYLYHAQQSV
jgi:hypothetical protein